jgi:MtaA/CmuA family methyltransferase
MTGKQRFLTALRGAEPDRVPIFLRDLTLGLDLIDVTTPDVSAGYDVDRAVEAVITSRRRFDQDAVVGCVHDLGLDVEPFGAEVDFPERGVPRVCRPPLADDAAARSAESFDPSCAGRWPQVTETYRQVSQRLGAEAAVAVNIEGPVTRAGVLRGLQQFSIDIMEDPGLAQALVDLSTEIAVRHVRRLGPIADFVFVAAASDGPAVISPGHYLQYTIPGLQRICDAARKIGRDVVFHPHGAFTDERFHHLVDAAIDCGISGFQFGEACDFAVAKRRWGAKVCILGGPDIATVLTRGPVQLVREDTRRYLDQTMAGGAYVIMASCSLHRGANLNYLDTMIKTVLEHGVYV